MKKRMFITTIVMMLVLAVALTTSSLAWFSSANISVTAQAATFTAATAGSSNVNLKISDTLGGWSNQISLTSGGRTLAALVPTEPLISAAAVGEDITTTGVTVNGAHVDVTHKGYVWPSKMVFNSAKIGSESNFVIDDGANAVETFGSEIANTTARKASVNYYYDYFYIQNADLQNSIGNLTFQLDSSITNIASGSEGYQANDYTARGYAAFIIWDQVKYNVGDTVPANAFTGANCKVVAFSATPDTDEVKEDAADAGYITWIPFAAFTIATDKESTDSFVEAPWQFADLDAKEAGEYIYQNAQITSLKTQNYDALSGISDGDGFVLNTTSLRALNSKIVNATNGKVDNSGAGYVRETADTASQFIMNPGEIFMVSMYYWLDGQSLTEFTDTTVSRIGVSIKAAQ